MKVYFIFQTNFYSDGSTEVHSVYLKESRRDEEFSKLQPNVGVDFEKGEIEVTE